MRPRTAHTRERESPKPVAPLSSSGLRVEPRERADTFGSLSSLLCWARLRASGNQFCDVGPANRDGPATRALSHGATWLARIGRAAIDEV